MPELYDREKLAGMLLGKRIEHVEWIEEERYWVLDLDSGEEISVRLMADLAALGELETEPKEAGGE